MVTGVHFSIIGISGVWIFGRLWTQVVEGPQPLAEFGSLEKTNGPKHFNRASTSEVIGGHEHFPLNDVHQRVLG